MCILAAFCNNDNKEMKILYYDCFSGISGDMNLGAMLDLGIKSDVLLTELQKLSLEGWKINVSHDQRHGITGTRVTVITEHEEDMDQARGHHHHHRNFKDIEAIVMNSSLSPEVKELSMKIFRRIAEAEAEVHNVAIDKIHFHEVGALDSIIDIVGAAVCYISLGVEKVYVSDVELGSGIVRCEHGLLPVPAPATARIIAGFPVHKDGVDFEATTPTGAAILASLAEPAPPALKFKINSTGYGIGQKDNPALPNVLRVFLAETENNTSLAHKSYMVECNLDDMNPELSDHISARLFEKGAQDIFFSHIIMKKGRPAFALSVICEEEKLDAVKEVIFTETTTIGLRIIPFFKETLSREFEEIETRFGKVMIKKSFYNNRLVSAKPEADRCAAIAAETGLPMKQVMQEIMALIWKKT